MKAIRRIPVFLLALMMLLSCITPAHALESQYTLWPVFSPIYDDYYIASHGFVHFEGWDKGVFFTAIKNSYVQLTLPEGTSNFNLTQIQAFALKIAHDGIESSRWSREQRTILKHNSGASMMPSQIEVSCCL